MYNMKVGHFYIIIKGTRFFKKKMVIIQRYIQKSCFINFVKYTVIISVELTCYKTIFTPIFSFKLLFKLLLPIYSRYLLPAACGRGYQFVFSFY